MTGIPPAKIDEEKHILIEDAKKNLLNLFIINPEN
jgi:hypothetical protein